MKRVTLKEFQEELGRLPQEQVDILAEVTFEALNRSVPDLVRESPVDTGQYAASWSVERKSKLESWIGNYAPHAPFIEYGTRPYRPPIGPLLEWARRMLQEGPAIDSATGGAVIGPSAYKAQPEDYSPEVRSLAFAVQAKIANEGMAPRHILEKQIPKIIDQIIADFRALGAK